MKLSTSLRNLVLLWLSWAIILIAFQKIAGERFQPQRPDLVLQWTPSETRASSQNDQPYLLDPVLNEQVSWDSEFYLSIATVGYEDPDVRTLRPRSDTGTTDERLLSLNYAFFPLYPLAMRLVTWPLRLVGIAPIAASAIAGVTISLLGTFAGMLALHDLTNEELGEEGGLRTAFYLLIFPTGFFLAQVYTEGLFIGLAFGSLALTRRKQWVAAAVLAALATWTRAVGAALVIPLALSWYYEVWSKEGTPNSGWSQTGVGILVLLPIFAYGIWNLFLGEQFRLVEASFFSRGAFLMGPSLNQWMGALSTMVSGTNPQATIYYALEFATMALAFGACLATFKSYPGLSLFGLAVLLISASSGVAQSMARYVLAVPSIYILLSRWGKNPVFDRAWTLASVLLMGLLATLFTFDMWVA